MSSKETITGTFTGGDWRLSLFGPEILVNQSDKDVDVETSKPFETLEDALKNYSYVAVFFGADYCPHCKLFAPKIIQSLPEFERRECKVLFCSNDRDMDAHERSLAKVRGIDAIPYDLNRTRRMRDLFGVQTIPALIVLHNRAHDETSNNKDEAKQDHLPVIANARHLLESDPTLQNFPWSPQDEQHSKKKGNNDISFWERVLVQGTHGKWYHSGHRNVSSTHPSEMYVDEHAVRIRAGLLNTITWFAIMNILFFRELTLVWCIYTLVAFEFLISITIGLTPLAPLGVVATLLSTVFHPKPLWKPANPKRFAWTVGFVLATSCLAVVVNRNSIHSDFLFRGILLAIASICNIFTWLESSCGFCFGCFIYNKYLVKWFGMNECHECE